jgi:hypothetical protein
MLDYYSNFPPPSHTEAIEEVVRLLKQKNAEYDESKLRKITTDIIEKIPCLGSYTGWYVSVKGDVIKNVINQYDANLIIC